MLIAIDKRGSINLPAALRKELGLKKGTFFDMEVEEGGAIVLYPVSIHRGIHLSPQGIQKLAEARTSGRGAIPDWLAEDMKNARTDPDPEIS